MLSPSQGRAAQPKPPRRRDSAPKSTTARRSGRRSRTSRSRAARTGRRSPSRTATAKITSNSRGRRTKHGAPADHRGLPVGSIVGLRPGASLARTVLGATLGARQPCRVVRDRRLVGVAAGARGRMILVAARPGSSPSGPSSEVSAHPRRAGASVLFRRDDRDRTGRRDRRHGGHLSPAVTPAIPPGRALSFAWDFGAPPRRRGGHSRLLGRGRLLPAGEGQRPARAARPWPQRRSPVRSLTRRMVRRHEQGPRRPVSGRARARWITRDRSLPLGTYQDKTSSEGRVAGDDGATGTVTFTVTDPRHSPVQVRGNGGLGRRDAGGGHEQEPDVVNGRWVLSRDSVSGAHPAAAGSGW